MNFTQEKFNKLFDPDNISMREYREIVTEIEEKTHAILKFIAKESDGLFEWWDWGREKAFDPKSNIETITTTGEYAFGELEDNPFFPYHEGKFPTALLWDENWQTTISNNIEEARAKRIAEKAKAKQKRIDKEKRRAAAYKAYHEKLPGLVESIRMKLTDEEWAVIQIKQ